MNPAGPAGPGQWIAGLALARLRVPRRLIWRHTWTTRYAHHPLCTRHRVETWRLGALHVCRGCVCLTGGLLLGNTGVWMLGPDWTLPAVLALSAPLLLASWPRWYLRWPRVLRDGLRLALGVWITALTATLALHLWVALVILPLLGLLLWHFRRSRAQVQTRRCEGCPELGQGICSGYRLQADAQRRIALEMEARLERSDG